MRIFFTLIAAGAVGYAILLVAQERGFEGPGGRGGRTIQNPIVVALDSNKDGVVSASELRNAPNALRTLDKDADGRISRDEARIEMPGRRGPGASVDASSELLNTLMAFDGNKDGKLTKDELPDRMQGMLERGDTDKDGALSNAEIRQLASSQQANAQASRSGREGEGRFGGREGRGGRGNPFFEALDADADGMLSAGEISNAPAAAAKLDRNGDGELTADEVAPSFGRGFWGERRF